MPALYRCAPSFTKQLRKKNLVSDTPYEKILNYLNLKLNCFTSFPRIYWCCYLNTILYHIREIRCHQKPPYDCSSRKSYQLIAFTRHYYFLRINFKKTDYNVLLIFIHVYSQSSELHPF